MEHKVWGRGMVVSVSDSGGDLLLSIAFPGKGIKKVMAHLAPITKVYQGGMPLGGRGSKRVEQLRREIREHNYRYYV